jgi:hypothetical protein
MHPTSKWIAQIARNVTDCQDGFLCGKRFLIIDRDSIFSSSFTGVLEAAGVGILRTA